MTSLFISELNKLKNIQLSLQKNDNLVNILTKYRDEIDLCEFFEDIEKTSKKEIDHITNELKGIFELLQRKSDLIKTHDLNKIDLKRFKKDAVELQDRIHTLKINLKIKLENLNDEQKELAEQNDVFNKKLSEWENLAPNNLINYTVNKQTRTEFNSNKEVAEFLSFISKSNGHENNWSNEDHLLFLKIRKKYKDIDSLAANLHKLLPDIDQEEIRKHENWYRQYLVLKNKKNEALKKWRETRKEKLTTEALNNDNNSLKTKNEPKVNNYINNNKTVDEEFQRKLEEWKAQKEEKKQRQKELEAMLQLRAKQKYEEKRRVNAEIKKVVEKWREAKLMKEENDKIQKEIQEYREKKLKSIEANKMIKQFRSQDDLYIMRMRSSKEKEKREVKRSKSSNLVSRDPGRLFKPTKQWLLRTAKSDNVITEFPTHPVPNLALIPKLRVPEWRKTHQI